MKEVTLKYRPWSLKIDDPKNKEYRLVLDPTVKPLGPEAVSEDSSYFKKLGIENNEEINKGQRGRPFKTFVRFDLPDGGYRAVVLFQYIKPQRLVKKFKEDYNSKVHSFAYILNDNSTTNLFFYNKKGKLMESFDTRVLYSYNNNKVTIENKVYKPSEEEILEGKEKLKRKFVGECV
jgi:hypothetical protein